MQALAKERRSAVASLQRHTEPAADESAGTSPRDVSALPPPSAQPSSSELHARARAAALARSTGAHGVSHSAAAGLSRSSSAELSTLLTSVAELQQQLKHSAAPAAGVAALGAQDLGQVAAAAAVAAAQAVKKDSDSELSQVLKAVLLQQSRLGQSGGAEGPAGAWVPWRHQGGVHVQGQLLVPGSATRSATTATPQVRLACPWPLAWSQGAKAVRPPISCRRRDRPLPLWAWLTDCMPRAVVHCMLQGAGPTPTTKGFDQKNVTCRSLTISQSRHTISHRHVTAGP